MSSKVAVRIVNISFTILLMLLIIFGLYRLGLSAYDFGYRVFTEPAMTSADAGTDKVVQVSQGESGYEIGQTLEDKGLVRSALLFATQLRLSSYADSIKPGTYTLNTSMTGREMMQMMSAAEEETEEQ